MAKRKPARSATRKRAAKKRTRSAGARRRRPAARTGGKTPSRRMAGAKRRTSRAKTAKATARTRSRPAGRKSAAAPRKTATRKTARKAAAPARTAAAPKAAAKKPSSPRTLPRKSAAAGWRGPGDRRPHLERDRRILEESVPGSPSTLDFDRHASAARSGRQEMREALAEHTETSPRLTGGDVDADWESAFSTGDEAPGGDMPTPDQDIVDEIGASLGVQYNDDEELKAVDKIQERDRHRWELNPASSDDYVDRNKK
jgi:hypothetical protein